ncbi:hypothetical protein MMC26_007603 [Xylographa opegraphella]|nr:hypothetical protein [Xylographa opegraphella]
MASEHLNEEGFQATSAALNNITDQTLNNHGADPRSTLHRPADHEHAHSFLSKILPEHVITGLESKFHMGNYVIDRQTGQRHWEAMSIYVRVGMHLLYYGSEQEKALHWKRTLDLLREQSEKMGREYDRPDSKGHIRPFIESFHLQASMAEMVQPDPDRYACFNDFFAREIRPDARPIAEPANPHVVSSPADCRLTAFPTVDLATKYWIKGYGFTMERLLGDAAMARSFDGGSMVIARLAPQDYHRWHAPVSGTVEAIKDIPGAYYTVNPQAINEAGTLDVFCENKRSVMTVRRHPHGTPTAIVAVGAMLVGSIKYVNGVDTLGTQIHRGQCLGAFYYGGSTVIVIYPPGEVALDQDLVHNSIDEKCETLMKVGWRVGVSPVGDGN